MDEDESKKGADASYGAALAEKTMTRVKKMMHYENRDTGLAFALAQLCLLLVQKNVITGEEIVSALDALSNDMLAKTSNDSAISSESGVAIVDLIRNYIAKRAAIPTSRS